MSQEDHYKMQVEGGTWKVVTKKDEQIVAFEARIEALTTTTSRNNTNNVNSKRITLEQRAIKYG